MRWIKSLGEGAHSQLINLATFQFNLRIILIYETNDYSQTRESFHNGGTTFVKVSYPW
jgi:hypothetical protein